MFPANIFAPVFFAPRYFAKIGGIFTAPVPGRAAVTISGSKLAAKGAVTQ